MKVEDGKTQDVAKQEDGCRTATELRHREAAQTGPETKQGMSRQNSGEKMISEMLGSSESAMKMGANPALEKITHEQKFREQEVNQKNKMAVEMGM